MGMNFKNYLQNEPDLIIIEIDGRILTKLKLDLVSEGVWKDSNISGWTYRVDPPNPQLGQPFHPEIQRRQRPLPSSPSRLYPTTSSVSSGIGFVRQ